MAEDLGHFTSAYRPAVEVDDEARNIKLKTPASRDIILSFSTEAAYEIGHELIRAAFIAERRFRGES